MKILLLPGASKSNIGWLDSWNTQLTKAGFDVKGIQYDHWANGGNFDFKSELSKLIEFAGTWKETFVLCKSIGTLLLMFCAHQKNIFPSGAIFMGLPSNLNGEKDETFSIDLDTWLSDYNVPTWVFQNECDPVTSFEQVKLFLNTRKNFILEKIPGDSHSYTTEIYLKKVLKILKNHKPKTCGL